MPNNLEKNTFFISTPIYYPNAKPHLGTLYSTLLADVFARWNRQVGKEVFFLTGLDEHGQKIAEAASSNQMTCQDFVDQMSLPFIKCWKDYDLSYDFFIKTSSEKHVKAVTFLFEKLLASGDIYKGFYSEYYCVSCERQIQKEEEIEIVICPQCNREAKKIEEENYFFRLSNYQDRLLKFYEDNHSFVTPSNRLAEVISFVKTGLKDLSISRTTVKWGIPFPQDPKHTIYVWGDALTNYISAIGYGINTQADNEMFQKFWPASVHVMAKDILRFHAIYWPAFLMAAGLPLPQKLLVHGYILVGDQKMSKSLGNAVDPEELCNQFGNEAVRYYLAKQMVVTQDGSFDLNELQNCYNADLANNFGNLINRVLTLACKNNLEIIKPIQKFNDQQCNELIDLASNTAIGFCKQMDEYSASTAIQLIMNLCSATNSLVHQKEPWKIVKSNYELFTEVISASAQTLNLCAHLLKPFIPTKAVVVLQALGSKINQHKAITCVENTFWQETLSLTIPSEPIFPRFESIKKHETEQPISSEEKKNMPVPNVDYISFEDLQKVKLSVGQIMLAEPVKGSSKLLRLDVDFGELGKRQVVSGIAEYYKPENLVLKKAIFVVNLAARKIMGLESQAMILAAKDGSNFSITILENDLVVPGTILS